VSEGHFLGIGYSLLVISKIFEAQKGGAFHGRFFFVRVVIDAYPFFLGADNGIGRELRWPAARNKKPEASQRAIKS
jgi:hypothetical protein